MISNPILGLVYHDIILGFIIIYVLLIYFGGSFL